MPAKSVWDDYPSLKYYYVQQKRAVKIALYETLSYSLHIRVCNTEYNILDEENILRKPEPELLVLFRELK